jgi:type IV pilus assembly protein PilC
MSTAVTYDYRVRDRAGAMHSGQMEASSTTAVAKTLREKGWVPLHIAEHRVGSLDRQIKIPGFGGKVKTKEVAILSRQLATMISSGLTLVRALIVLEEQSQNPLLASVVADVRTRVEQGASLSVALGEHPRVFTSLYVSMIQAGEVGGALDETLTRLADTLEAATRLRSKVKSAMAYPVVVLALILLIVTAMLLFIVPVFEKMYSDLGGTLPVPTQMLVKASSLLAKFWWLFALATIGVVIGLRRWVATKEGRRIWDRFKLRMPIFGTLVQKVAISRFARTFSVLSRTGVPVLQSLDIVSLTAGNAMVSDALQDVKAAVKRGEPLAAPLQKHTVFPPMVTNMMAVGEETGALDAMLAKVADFYDQEVDDSVSAITSLIEPILIVVMGLAVGGILISLYLPMFNIAKLIR